MMKLRMLGASCALMVAMHSLASEDSFDLDDVDSEFREFFQPTEEAVYQAQKQPEQDVAVSKRLSEQAQPRSETVDDVQLESILHKIERDGLMEQAQGENVILPQEKKEPQRIEAVGVLPRHEEEPAAVISWTESQRSSAASSSSPARQEEGTDKRESTTVHEPYLLPQTKIEALIRNYRLMPLVDSEIWREHPGQLPYSACLLTAWHGQWDIVDESAFFYSISSSLHDENQTLFCYSRSYRTAFMVPAAIVSDKAMGLTITFSAMRSLRAKVKKLKGKPLHVLFGKYGGIHGGLGYLSSVSGAYLKNQADVAMQLNSSGGADFIDLSLAYRKLKLQPRRLLDLEIYNPAYLRGVEAMRLAKDNIGACFPDNSDCQNFMKQQDWLLQYLSTLTNDQKFAPLYRYWVHLLGEHENPELVLHGEIPANLLQGLQFIKTR